MTKKPSPATPPVQGAVQGTVVLPMSGGSFIVQNGELMPESGPLNADLTPVETGPENTPKPDEPKAEA